ncbi:MAG: ComEC/Rec2 family competence protein, partial [Nitrospinota bacterium]
MKKPIIPILLFYIAGIIYGRYLPFYLIHLTALIIVALLIAAILTPLIPTLNLRGGRGGLKSYHILIPALSLLAGAIAINYQFMTLPDNHISNLISDKKVSVEGILYKLPEVVKNRTRLYVDVQKISDRDTIGKVKVTLYNDTTDASYKDRIRIKDLRLHIPRNFKNPGGFDYKRFMEDQGIYVIGSISKGRQIEIINKYEGDIFSDIYKSKDRMSIFIEENAPPDESSILKTMVFGEKSAVSKEMRNIFSSTGIAHLLAVSGLHVGFVAFASFLTFKKFFSLIFLNFFYRLFLIGAVQRFAAFFTIFPVLYYSILVGESPSSVRATIMAVVYLLSITLQREGNIFNTLSIAALIILIWHPPSLFNAGFQLSFMAVLSIAYGFLRLPDLLS